MLTSESAECFRKNSRFACPSDGESCVIHSIFALRIWETSAFAVIPFPSGTIPINEKTSTQASNIETAFPAHFLNIKRPP
jgi:hypothetical protein